jgi:HEAT repeat protein
VRRRRRLDTAGLAGHDNTTMLEGGGHDRGLSPAHSLAALAQADHPESRALLEHALTSDDPELRRVAVAGLGHLGAIHDWAVDGLITALTTGADTPARVAAQLDRLAPRTGARLAALLSHPDATVRFWALRLLAPSNGLVADRVVELLDDPEPRVRAAALASLRGSVNFDALRGALDLLDDEEPRVRAHACRTVATGGSKMAPFLVPLVGDPSWWVRQAAHDALREIGTTAEELIAVQDRASDAAVWTGIDVLLNSLARKPAPDEPTPESHSPESHSAADGQIDWPDDLALVGRP